jgi:hypothetical protein
MNLATCNVFLNVRQNKVSNKMVMDITLRRAPYCGLLTYLFNVYTHIYFASEWHFDATFLSQQIAFAANVGFGMPKDRCLSNSICQPGLKPCSVPFLLWCRPGMKLIPGCKTFCPGKKLLNLRCEIPTQVQSDDASGVFLLKAFFFKWLTLQRTVEAESRTRKLRTQKETPRCD